MYCTQCGLELAADAKFCSSCGNALSETAPPLASRDWNFHVGMLGWLVIAHASFTALIGLIVMFGGQLMGGLIRNNPNLFDHADPDLIPPPEFVNLLGPVTFLIGVIFLLVATPSIAAGVGLLRYRNWGRMLTLILSFLRLMEFPFGTFTAIYSFWVLLSREGKNFFSERAARAEV